MKTLTVRQPWAHCIMHLGKDIENRGWQTHHRGPLAIHAGCKRAEMGIFVQLRLDPNALIYGAIIGIVDVIDCIRDSDSPWAMAGQWHWILANPRALAQPITMRGRLSLFDVDPAILEAGG